jgi:hypothetical protein
MADGGFAPPAKDLVQSSELWNPITTPEPTSRQGLSLDERGEIPNHAFPYMEAINIGDRFSPGFTQWFSYSDFLSPTGNIQGDFSPDQSGTGAGDSSADSESNHPGTVFLSTGTTTSGRAGFRTKTSDTIRFGTGQCSISWIIKTPSSLSDGTNRYDIVLGFFNAFSATTLGSAVAGQYGAFFLYRDSINSGKWQAATTDGSTYDAGDTNITVDTSTWYLLEVEISPNANVANYKINGNIVYSTTSGIPSSSQGTSAMCFIRKILGTTARIFTVDAVYMRGTVSGARY